MTASKNILLKNTWGMLQRFMISVKNYAQYSPVFKTINCVDGISFHTTHPFPKAIVNMRLLLSQDGLQMHGAKMIQLHYHYLLRYSLMF